MQPAIAAVGSNLLIASQIQQAAAQILENRLPIQMISLDELARFAPASIYLCPDKEKNALQKNDPQAVIIGLKTPAHISREEAAGFLSALSACFQQLAAARITMLPSGQSEDATDLRALQGLADELEEAIDLLRQGAIHCRLPHARRPAKATSPRKAITIRLQKLSECSDKLHTIQQLS